MKTRTAPLPDKKVPQSLSSFTRVLGESVKKMLVVDDDPTVSRLVSEILQEWGYAVTTASNGKEGLVLLQAHRFDGILLDLDMPIMDGQTMLDELRWQGDPTPVVVMSGGADASVLRGMLKEGAQGFLVKPFSLESLRAKCEQVFGCEAPAGTWPGQNVPKGVIATQTREVA